MIGRLVRVRCPPGCDSDLDVVLVRRKGVDGRPCVAHRCCELDGTVSALTGNLVEVLEVSEPEVARLLRSRSPLWVDVQRDGGVVFGTDLAELQGRSNA